MKWICKFLGDHKPDDTVTEYRERDGLAPLYEDYHFERYSTCLRCGEEISYARFFNWWGSKDRITKLGREWLDETIS